MTATRHGGKRENAGRKKLADAERKQTTVIRVDSQLLPAIEQLKHGLNPVTENQRELERWQQRNMELVLERDQAILTANKLQEALKLNIENKAAKTPVVKQKTPTRQCITAKGIQCSKPALHENIVNGFVVFTCERHYQTKINSANKGSK